MKPDLSERERQNRLALLLVDAQEVGRSAGRVAAGPWLDETDVATSVRRLCVERAIVPAARRRMRYSRVDLMTDDDVIQRLAEFAEIQVRNVAQVQDTSLPAGSADGVTEALVVEATRILRDCLITTLEKAYGLDDVVADACRRAGIEGREPQLAYCLVVLCQKLDPERSGPGGRIRAYRLDVGEPGFAERLRHWADTVANNLRDWASAYDAIHREAARFETNTLRSIIRVRDADIASVVADKLVDTISAGQRLEDMTLRLARDITPAQAEYVFQSPLGRWVATVERRRVVSVEPIDVHEALREADARPTLSLGSRLGETSSAMIYAHDERGELRWDVHRQLLARVAGLAQTRDVLSRAVEVADDLERRAADMQLAGAEDSGLFQKVRAELAAVTDDLRREQRSFDPMLAYILLAMRPAGKRQQVAILSLRGVALDRRVTEHIADRMRAMITKSVSPAPALIARTAQAPPEMVPRNRLKELWRLRDDEDYRNGTYAALARQLTQLPDTVTNLASIGAAVAGGMTPGTVATARNQIVTELRVVDRYFARVFQRYAMPVAGEGPALERYVAHVPGDNDDLASAIAEGAMDRTINAHELLRDLSRPQVGARILAVRRIARMRGIGPRLAAQLAIVAASDADAQTRAAAADALRGHGLPVPACSDAH